MLRVHGLSVLRGRRATPVRVGVGTLMRCTVGPGVWVVGLPYLLGAIRRRGGRPARVGACGGVIAIGGMRAAVGSIGGSTVAVVPAVPGSVPIIRSAMVVRAAAVPVAVPTAIAPAAAASAHHRANCHPGAKGKQAGSDYIGSGVVGNNVWRAVNHGWVVLRNIHNLRIGRLNNDGLRRLLHHGDLRPRLEIAGRLRLLAQGLY